MSFFIITFNKNNKKNKNKAKRIKHNKKKKTLVAQVNLARVAFRFQHKTNKNIIYMQT